MLGICIQTLLKKPQYNKLSLLCYYAIRAEHDRKYTIMENFAFFLRQKINLKERLRITETIKWTSSQRLKQIFKMKIILRGHLFFYFCLFKCHAQCF